MAQQKSVSESLEEYVVPCKNGHGKKLHIPEGKYRGWVPRVLYTMDNIHELRLPFLRLLSFPVGGTALGPLATNLTVFEAVGNHLTKLPNSFSNCDSLIHLDLSFNYFSEIPLAVLKLANLKHLNMEHNDIIKVDPRIGHLKSLENLNLNGNMLSSLPNELSKCKKLKELRLAGKFHPRGGLKQFPECICELRDLVILNLSWQKINNIPDSFGKLRNLEELSLKWNHLQKVSPEIVKCQSLTTIDLSGALRFLSYIPQPLFQLEDLKVSNLLKIILTFIITLLWWPK